MKRVELAEVRAMLREVVATYGNDSKDVAAVMALNRKPTKTSVPEVNDVIDNVERAWPSRQRGTIALDETEWIELEDLYYRRVMQPVFA